MFTSLKLILSPKLAAPKTLACCSPSFTTLRRLRARLPFSMQKLCSSARKLRWEA
jgi:hypothetical protein